MKPNQTKNNAQFSIEMDFKGMLVFMILVALTGATLFYLGMIFGKASRSPNEDLRPSMSDTEESPGDLQTPKDLKIYDLGNNAENVDSLKKEFESLKADSQPTLNAESNAVKQDAEATRQLAAAAQRLEADRQAESAPAPAAAAQPTDLAEVPKPGSAPGISWPEVARETRGETGPEYTIQIFTTRDTAKAERMVGQLKQKGFDAYSEEIRLEGNLLYRVRVGRGNQDKIERIKTRLSGVVEGLGRLQVVQIR
ncbi:MAG: SPOR domain-containing protein [bacterium]|nr:SPOR domain-containing protein [bacterium]